jgi:GNAT superfamily N-acetyltransferase
MAHLQVALPATQASETPSLVTPNLARYTARLEVGDLTVKHPVIRTVTLAPLSLSEFAEMPPSDACGFFAKLQDASGPVSDVQFWLSETHSRLHLENMSVRPGFQQQGVGSAALTALEQLCDGLELRLMTLEAVTADGIRLWQRHGFKLRDPLKVQRDLEEARDRCPGATLETLARDGGLSFEKQFSSR